MTMVFLLEDLSMKALLEGLLPRLLPEGVPFLLIPHEGKADLDRSIPKKLRAWQDPNARFVILRDQDNADCIALKKQLLDVCNAIPDRRVLVRIACKEVESWYLADFAALDRVFASSLTGSQNKRKYRDPDQIVRPSKEVAKLVPSFGKVSGARLLGGHLALENERSTSFRQFVTGIRSLVSVDVSAE